MKAFLTFFLFIALYFNLGYGVDLKSGRIPSSAEKSSSQYAGPILKLKEKLAEAIPGSYLVLEQNKNFTFFYIRDRVDQKIILEEATIPVARCAKGPMNWKTWFEKGAPGHTGWIISQVNLETGIFEETFSFTHQGWVDLSDANSFLTTLLNLRFYTVPEGQRRRVGSAPGQNSGEKPPLWKPRLIVEGQSLTNIAFVAYKARWPADRSELSRKVIEIYIPNSEDATTNFPAYFPYWLEIDGAIGSAKIRVVDSGMHAHSPQSNLPKRIPQLIGDISSEGDYWKIQLHAPHYFRTYTVVAREENAFFGSTFPVSCTCQIDKKEKVSLMISKTEFIKLAVPKTSYLLDISPTDDPSIVLHLSTPVQSPLSTP